MRTTSPSSYCTLADQSPTSVFVGVMVSVERVHVMAPVEEVVHFQSVLLP